MPRKSRAIFTDEELKEDAKRFTTRKEWEAFGKNRADDSIQSSSKYRSASRKGREFMRECCAHMIHGKKGNDYHVIYSDEELIEAGKRYSRRVDWRKGDRNTYYSALGRPEVYEKATEHMGAKENKQL